MKKKLLLTSILSIVMCLSLITGATFALFTSESTVNVAVTSGTVKVTATVDGFEYKTLKVTEWTKATNNETDFDGIGGSAKLVNGGELTLDKIVPGDAVKFTVKVENASDVTIKCRTSVRNLSESSALFDELKVTVNDNDFSDAKISDWTEVVPTTTSVETFNIVIELPENTPSVKNDVNLMGETAKLQIMVEAVQGNATTTNDVPVSTAGELEAAIASGTGKPITLSGDLGINKAIEISGDVVINGNGETIDRASGYTGAIFTVKENASLTLNNVIIDSSAIVQQATGYSARTYNSNVVATESVIVAEKNAEIILGEGVKIMNHKGSYAINLGTRIGATLVIDGAEIINCDTDNGVIWGGGHITMKSGKISGNHSKGIAGVIRMVSSCNFTMIGGEITNNVAEGDGGVIWGYGSSTYNLEGGKIAYNESKGTGGVIYSGTYSVINISGDFEMHDNKAANSGAIRLTDHTSLNMTGGKIYNNTQNGEDNCFNTWNNTISITGGEISDNISYFGGLGLTIGGNAKITGVIAYGLSTNHNTAYLGETFEGFSFTVNENNTNFAQFNLNPADGYVYTEGDEAKLVCLNEGYTTYWDSTTETFRLKAE